MRIEPFVPNGFPKIMIIGEAPGAEEVKQNRPFVGASGRLLSELLNTAGIIRNDCYLTNVFMERPPNNDLAAWCTNKKVADRLWQEAGNEGKYPYKGVASGKYIVPERLFELQRLHDEITRVNPNVIIALGNTPLWALTGKPGITATRGTVVGVEVNGVVRKVIPTFHPAYVLRKWDSKLIVIADLMKASEEQHTREIKRPKRELWIEPTIADIDTFTEKYLAPAKEFAWDIETKPKGGFITCIGFGTTTHAICIPFYDTRKPDGNYWETAAAEVLALRRIAKILTLPNPKITHNGMYDIQWVWKQWGISPRGEILDTQLLHHSMYPELRKSLALLGSLYTNETAWKQLKPLHRTEKKDA